MRVLLIDGFEGDDPIVAAAVDTLGDAGHQVRTLDLARIGFAVAMSTAERRAYDEEGANLLSPETRDAAELLRWAEALLFCCPTVAHSVPARVKGFLDRVLVPGVAFTFDEKGEFVPTLRHIQRLGLITRVPHGRLTTARSRDGARRSILWTVRLNCARTCRRTYVRLAPADDVGSIISSLRRW
ncbi:MAG: NAD(P)H-dependent oxidoreductase [Acidimicrobiales bacterium]